MADEKPDAANTDIGGDRPKRTCIACGKTDDHPRCQVDIGGGTVLWHMDCHFMVHGPLPCHPLITDAATAPKGADLLAEIMGES